MLEDTKKYINDVVGTSVENILYFICIVILGIVEKHGRKNIGGCLKRAKKIALKVTKATKKTHHWC
jgi:hypothetical protein